MTNPTPEEIEAARAIVAKADADAMNAMQDAIYESYQPLRDFVSSAAFTQTKTAARELAPLFRDDDNVYPHLRPMVDFMDRLSAWVMLTSRPVPPA